MGRVGSLQLSEMVKVLPLHSRERLFKGYSFRGSRKGYFFGTRAHQVVSPAVIMCCVLGAFSGRGFFIFLYVFLRFRLVFWLFSFCLVFSMFWSISFCEAQLCYLKKKRKMYFHKKHIFFLRSTVVHSQLVISGHSQNKTKKLVISRELHLTIDVEVGRPNLPCAS